MFIKVIKGWRVDATDHGAEVTPVDDAVGHTEGDDCACLPTVEHIRGNNGASYWLVTHHAWDGRE